MFGLEFLFTAALWALPLAGLPVLLHMLFRRRSPLVPFPTLRFIKASIQQTAARRRIQRWVLLACRMLLLALLIWAISQPVRILASGWLTTGHSMIAAIVVDTSYSMQLKQQELPLLDRANDTIGELLRGPLKDAKIAVFRSRPPDPDQPEHLETATEIESKWSPLRAQPALMPLVERCGDAIEFLGHQQADQKWLIVLSDMQSREFPHLLPDVEGARVVLFDLHPEKPDSHGIASVQIDPPQPIPGAGAEAAIEVTGRGGDAPFLDLHLTGLDGQPRLPPTSNVQVNFESTGRANARIPLRQQLPADRWLLVTAKLQRDDDLPWDNERSQLIELPPKQAVTFIASPVQPAASNMVHLDLDPWKGAMPSWPLQVKDSTDLSGKEQTAVMLASEWPDAARAHRFLSFARGGGTLILLLQPGLEQSWATLSRAQQADLLPLLPAPLAPTLPGGGSPGATGTYYPTPPARPDRILQGLTDPSMRLNLLAIRRFVPFAPPTDPAVSTLLYLSPAATETRPQSFGLLYRRDVGAGRIFVLSTLPDARYLSFAAHPLFLPLMVNMCLQPPEAQNVELGQPLVLTGDRYANYAELEIQGPAGERYRVKPTGQADARRFIFETTLEPGLYYWRKTKRPGHSVRE